METDSIDREKDIVCGELGPSRRLAKDHINLNIKWRTLIVIEPGINKPERNFYLSWHVDTERFLEDTCTRDVRNRAKKALRRIAKYLRN